MAVMKDTELIEKVLDIAKNYKTLYVYGCFGAPMTSKNKERYSNYTDFNKRKDRQEKILSESVDENTFGFDCVNLIKGVLWCWCGDKTKTYGGAKYATNGVPDIGADQMITVCTDISTDFTKIIPGEALWMKGHIGVYVGDGLGVESTPAFADRVQITAVKNIGSKEGYPDRKWTKHGKLPYIEYATQNVCPEIPKITDVFKLPNYLQSIMKSACTKPVPVKDTENKKPSRAYTYGQALTEQNARKYGFNYTTRDWRQVIAEDVFCTKKGKSVKEEDVKSLLAGIQMNDEYFFSDLYGEPLEDMDKLIKEYERISPTDSSVQNSGRSVLVCDRTLDKMDRQSFVTLLKTLLKAKVSPSLTEDENKLSGDEFWSVLRKKDLSGVQKPDLIRSCCLTAQFITLSNLGDMRFLHSMDCSGSDLKLNHNKLIRWARFCIDVYDNREYYALHYPKGAKKLMSNAQKTLKKLTEWKLYEYLSELYSACSSDILVGMLAPLCATPDCLAELAYKLDNSSFGENKKGQIELITDHDEVSIIRHSFEELNEEKKLLFRTSELMELLKEEGKRSYFSEATIGTLFAPLKGYNPEYVALGSALHMLGDSFHSDNAIRNGTSKDGIPPITGFLTNKARRSGIPMETHFFTFVNRCETNEDMPMCIETDRDLTLMGASPSYSGQHYMKLTAQGEQVYTSMELLLDVADKLKESRTSGKLEVIPVIETLERLFKTTSIITVYESMERLKAVKKTKLTKIAEVKNEKANLQSKLRRMSLVRIGTILLQNRYPLPFVAGVLTNVYSEGLAGKFEGSDYRGENLKNKPKYLINMDADYDYAKKHSTKNIANVGLLELELLLNEITAITTRSKPYKFGLGSVQWTGSRTYTLMERYKQASALKDKPTLEEVLIAEAQLVLEELEQDKYHNSTYQPWLQAYPNMDETEESAAEAGRLVCYNYEAPANRAEKSSKRAELTKPMFRILSGKQ